MATKTEIMQKVKKSSMGEFFSNLMGIKYIYKSTLFPDSITGRMSAKYDTYMHQNKLLYAVRQKKLPDDSGSSTKLNLNYYLDASK
jgi:hypothetical protein